MSVFDCLFMWVSVWYPLHHPHGVFYVFFMCCPGYYWIHLLSLHFIHHHYNHHHYNNNQYNNNHHYNNHLPSPPPPPLPPTTTNTTTITTIQTHRVDNYVAIDLITEHIRLKLQQPELKRIYHNLEVIPSNFQIRGMHTIIRDCTTQTNDFVFYADRLLRLVC